MHVLSVVGARPQFVKLGPVAEALAAAAVQHTIVHTGQHYDPGMSDAFFADLAIPAPDVNLAVGSGSHGAQTAAMLSGLEGVLLERRPDWVLVYGDTNSTIAATLAAVKIHQPVAHLEAGLRSFNRRMPEEHNRVLTDHAADLCLAPTEVAMRHLAAEGLAARSVLTGDVMTDVCLKVAASVADRRRARPAGVEGEYVLATVHRAENTDDPVRLRAVVDALANLEMPVVLTAHPRLVAKAAEQGLDLTSGSLRTIAPLDYPAMVGAVLGARAVVTDSGGLQKEAFLLGTPCVTVRTETEWVETVESGWNVLVGDLAELPELVVRPAPSGARGTPYGDGNAAARAVQALVDRRI